MEQIVQFNFMMMAYTTTIRLTMEYTPMHTTDTNVSGIYYM